MRTPQLVWQSPIFDRERVIYQNYFGYADKENELSVDADTVLSGGLQQSFWWVSVMQLWEQENLVRLRYQSVFELSDF